MWNVFLISQKRFCIIFISKQKTFKKTSNSYTGFWFFWFLLEPRFFLNKKTFKIFIHLVAQIFAHHEYQFFKALKAPTFMVAPLFPEKKFKNPWIYQIYKIWHFLNKLFKLENVVMTSSGLEILSHSAKWQLIIFLMVLV